MASRITFMGAAGTVTGSKYLVDIDEPEVKKRILVDAGIFQGDHEWKDRNWEEYDRDLLSSIDFCILTHAHIDHTGFLPRLVKLGLNCPVYATPATCALAELLLLDSAKLQEDEAAYRQSKHNSRHKVPLPLYTINDAKEALNLFRSLAPNINHKISDQIQVEFRAMGHILGASSINLKFGQKCITFSGDIGRYAVPILKDPQAVSLGNLLLIESTYATTEHHKAHTNDQLAEEINKSVERGGVMVIPSFAVGRTQSLLYAIRELKQSRKISNVPVVIDSPMAADATELYEKFTDEYDHQSLKLLKERGNPFNFDRLSFTQSREESIKLNKIKGPMIVISASGMATGGRVLHHLKNRLPHENNTVLFVGYQSVGSRGDLIKQGRDWISIFHERIPVRAHVASIDGLSAHADRTELLKWLDSCSGRPDQVAVVHGEPESARYFANFLHTERGLKAFAPNYKETWDI